MQALAVHNWIQLSLHLLWSKPDVKQISLGSFAATCFEYLNPTDGTHKEVKVTMCSLAFSCLDMGQLYKFHMAKVLKVPEIDPNLGHADGMLCKRYHIM